MKYHSSRKQGVAMIMAAITIAILAIILSTTLRIVASRYNTSFQASSWQEALQGAESGADIAMVQLRAMAQDPTNPWTGWTLDAGTGTGAACDASNAATFPKTFSTSFTHAGEGNLSMRVSTTVDKPATLVDASGRQWYRVRTTGTTDISASPRVSTERLDNRLRKLGLVWNKATGAKLAKPQASRTIELVAKPVGCFNEALLSEVQFKNDNGGVLVDSYDSSDPAKSTLGIYDDTIPYGTAGSKIQANGDIGSNAYPIKHDKTNALGINADFIFGDVGNNYAQINKLDPAYYGSPGNPATNPDPTLIKTNGNGQVYGAVNEHFYRDLPRITDPSWSTITYPSVTKIDNKAKDITASSNSASPTRLKVSSINLGGKDQWTIKMPTSPVNGVVPTDAYVEIWVTGNIDLNDGGAVITEPGVHTTVYFDADVNIGTAKGTNLGGNGGFEVQSDSPGDLLLLGVEQPDSTKKKNDQFNTYTYTPYKATGNVVIKDSDFIGAIYAPDHNIVADVHKITGGGNVKRDHTGGKKGSAVKSRLIRGIDYYGAMVGRTIHAVGALNLHYDEALVNVGPVNDYGFVSWVEDVDLDHR